MDPRRRRGGGRVAAEKDFDCDEYELEQAMRSLAPADAASPWWEVIELAATFGAAGGGIAAVLMQEAAVAALVAALPLVAAGARNRKDRVRSRVAAERLVELREETRAMARKARRDVAVDDAASRAANAVVPRVSDVVSARRLRRSQRDALRSQRRRDQIHRAGGANEGARGGRRRADQLREGVREGGRRRRGDAGEGRRRGQG